jgi:N utilization substance protein B
MTDQPPSAPAAGPGGGRRRSPRTANSSPRTAARIFAVQALYQIEMSGAPADEVIAEFRDHRLTEDLEQTEKPDAELFSAVAAAASVRRAEIDGLIRSALAEGWKLERLDAVMRALLRAGVAELLDFADVPARVAIDQYVDVSHAFLGDKETGFVNGVLDRLARQLRPQEVRVFKDAA